MQFTTTDAIAFGMLAAGVILMIVSGRFGKKPLTVWGGGVTGFALVIGALFVGL